MVLIHGQAPPPESPPAGAPPLPSSWAASTVRPSSCLSAVRSAPALGSVRRGARPLVSGNRVVWRGGDAPALTDKGGRTEVSYLHDHPAEFASISDIVTARRRERPLTAAATIAASRADPITAAVAPTELPKPWREKHARINLRIPSRAGRAAGPSSSPVRYAVYPASKPPSRSEALQLGRVLDEGLAGAGGDVREEMSVWDRVLSELIRQVYVHCAERGDLLERVRVQQGEWMVGMLRAIDEVKAEAERAEVASKRAAEKQEERLRALLLANQGMQQRVAVLRREMEWARKQAPAPPPARSAHRRPAARRRRHARALASPGGRAC